MFDILIVSYSFIAALIGAGFASGQEILCYFAIFGRRGALGIVIAALLLSLFIYCTLALCIKKRAGSFNEFLKYMGGARIGRAIKLFAALFSFAVFSAMLSAFGEMLTPLGLPPRLGALLTALLCIFILSRGVDAILNFNGITGLILTCAIIICCIYMLRYREYHAAATEVPVISNAAVYAGYNLLSAIPLLTVMSRRLKNRAEAGAAALISGTAAALMMLMIFSLLAIYANRIPLGELPILTLAMRQNQIFAAIYRCILIAASATTLLACGSSILEAVSPRRRFFSAALISVLGYALSGAGFSSLVNTAYRACGIIGLLICIYIVIRYFTAKNKDFMR